VTVELGVLISVLSVVIAYQGYHLNKQKHLSNQRREENDEVKTDAKESAEVKAELGYIRKGVDDIRIDLRTNERERIALGERVTRVEESSKQAHKRLDAIENKGEM
jgi:Tfp pilus assembly protein PilO